MTFPKSPIIAALLLALAGCSLAPDYSVPSAPIPTAFKESGPWKIARPADQIARGEWWGVFADPVLDGFERQAQDANQDLQAAVARVKQARASGEAARSGLFPTLDAGFGATREKVSAASQFKPDGTDIPSQTLLRAQAGASYEADLFGRVGSTVSAAEADAHRSEALLRSVQLALQADVAQTYFTLRGLDAQQELYAKAVELREKTLTLALHRQEASEIGELDVARARSELAATRAEALAIRRARAASEHALATLLGKAPSDFAFPAAPLRLVVLDIPAGLPSALLERRPDIAAAERAMAAANARIGVARAAYYPSLNLAASGGFESAGIGDLFKWGSRTFLLGPLSGAELTLPLFDGGRRDADLARAKATYDEDVARYRQQVLTAFREVEDGLSDLNLIGQQRTDQDEAVAAARHAASLSREQYREGAVSYLDVVDAERTALQSQRSAVELQSLQMTATVNLIRSLGGGWEAPPPAS